MTRRGVFVVPHLTFDSRIVVEIYGCDVFNSRIVVGDYGFGVFDSRIVIYVYGFGVFDVGLDALDARIGVGVYGCGIERQGAIPSRLLGCRGAAIRSLEAIASLG